MDATERVPPLKRDRAFIAGMVLLWLGAGLSLLLALRGWGGRITTFDIVPHAMEAARLVEHGVVPSHGCLSSFGSYIPPGTSWLIVPGRLLFSDPRLETVPGPILLHVIGIVGVYLLGQWCWGRAVGVSAALIFALSPISLRMATDLWPRFPMAATVWFVYFMGRWCCDRKPWFFGAALVVLSLGLYVHLEGLLLAGAIPIVWLLFRPPVRFRCVLPALVIALIVWLPYLRFEQTRAYADLRSQFGRHSLFYQPAPFAQASALADDHGLPSLGTLNPEGTPQKALPWGARVLGVGDRLAQGLVQAAGLIGANIVSYGPGGWCASLLAAPLLLVLIGAVFPAVGARWPAACGLRAESGRGQSAVPGKAWNVLGFLCLAVACLANEWCLGRLMSAHGHMGDYTVHTIRLFQAGMVLAGLALLLRRPGLRWIRRASEKPVTPLAAVAVLLLLPWLIMAWMSGPGTPYRFWFIWPVQAAVGTGLVATWIAGWSRAGAVAKKLAVAVFLAVAVCNGGVADRLMAWAAKGWSGETDDVRAMRSLAAAIHEEGAGDAAIGYVMPFEPYMLYYSVLDTVYKVGLPYDWFLQRAYGIRNTRTTAAGCSSTDRYRLVADVRPGAIEVELTNVAFAGWRKAKQVGAYSIWISGTPR